MRISRTIEIEPKLVRNGNSISVGFTTSVDDQTIQVDFTVEKAVEPTETAATEAMLLAAIALAMQRKAALRVRGRVSRSLRHTVDLYQEACAYWWPHRYRRVPIEVDVVDDQPPSTARGLLCFSGGLDSIYSARNLAAARQIDSCLLVSGYDIDPENGGQHQQRCRVSRLIDRLNLEMIVIGTNVRQVLGQKVIEGAQGSYLAAALTLLSGRFGRGIVSSGLVDLSDVANSDPVHEATMPLLGSARFPISVYGGQLSRLSKLAEVAAEPELFRDLRVCLERADDGHCGRCAKCVLNAFAIVAVTGEWPIWYPQAQFDSRHLTAIRFNETRRRYAIDILNCAAVNGRDGEWRIALQAHVDAAGKPADVKAEVAS
jgi:hypothetical protein